MYTNGSPNQISPIPFPSPSFGFPGRPSSSNSQKTSCAAQGDASGYNFETTSTPLAQDPVLSRGSGCFSRFPSAHQQTSKQLDLLLDPFIPPLCNSCLASPSLCYLRRWFSIYSQITVDRISAVRRSLEYRVQRHWGTLSSCAFPLLFSVLLIYFFLKFQCLTDSSGEAYCDSFGTDPVGGRRKSLPRRSVCGKNM